MFDADGWRLPTQALFRSSPVGFRRNDKLIRSMSVPGEVCAVVGTCEQLYLYFFPLNKLVFLYWESNFQIDAPLAE